MCKLYQYQFTEFDMSDNYERCYHWGKQEDEYRGLHLLFLQLPVNVCLFQNKNFLKVIKLTEKELNISCSDIQSIDGWVDGYILNIPISLFISKLCYAVLMVYKTFL